MPKKNTNAETKRLNSLVEGLNCTVWVERGHTLLNYNDILNHGLIWYENKIDAELAKAPDNAYHLIEQIKLGTKKEVKRA